MTKITKRGNNLASRLSQLPTPNTVDKMFEDVNSSKQEKVTIERKKFGTQLRPELITKLKMRAIQEDMTISDLLEAMLDEYLE
jgi:fibrillarin-like rRNA methylase